MLHLWLFWDINTQDRLVSSSFSVVDNNCVTAVLQGVAAVSISTPPPKHFIFFSCSRQILFYFCCFLRIVHMNWHIYKERLSFTDPAGFRLRNSSRGAPVLTPDWMSLQVVSRVTQLRWKHCDGRRGLSLRGNIPHGSVLFFSDRLKKEPFVSPEPNPRKGAKSCSNFGRPAV